MRLARGCCEKLSHLISSLLSHLSYSEQHGLVVIDQYWPFVSVLFVLSICDQALVGRLLAIVNDLLHLLHFKLSSSFIGSVLSQCIEPVWLPPLHTKSLGIIRVACSWIHFPLLNFTTNTLLDHQRHHPWPISITNKWPKLNSSESDPSQLLVNGQLLMRCSIMESQQILCV